MKEGLPTEELSLLQQHDLACVSTIHIRASVLGPRLDVQPKLDTGGTSPSPNNTAGRIVYRPAAIAVRNVDSPNITRPGH